MKGPGLMINATAKRAHVNGISMRYLDWSGPADPAAPPAVILHGVLQRSEGMANLASHLARRVRVVVPDLRGRGGTDRAPDGYDPATMATDVAELIQTLDLGPCMVIGRIHGGIVAYHLAANHPGCVRGLVIGSTLPEVDATRAAQTLEGIRRLPRGFDSMDDAIVFYQQQLGLSEERARHDIPHDLQWDGDRLTWRHDLDVIERIERASSPRSDWEVVSRVKQPTLMLHGQRGPIDEEVCQKFCDAISGCTIQTVIGAGRDVFLGPGSEQTFGAIDAFLLRLTAPRQTALAS